MKQCPFCAEDIQDAAIVCKHCGRDLKTGALPSQPTVVVQAPPHRLWSPGVAAVLSLIIPGAGQMYKGQVIHGLAWLFLVIVGYLFLVIPGVILHRLGESGAPLGLHLRRAGPSLDVARGSVHKLRDSRRLGDMADGHREAWIAKGWAVTE